jgi:peptidylprolyl isomerase
VSSLKKSHLAALVATLGTLVAGSTIHAADNVSGASGASGPSISTTTQQAAAKTATNGFSREEILKLSEAFGHFIGRNLNNPGIDFDLDSIIRGMRSGVAGDAAPMSDQDYEKMMAKLQENAYRQLSEDNLKAANAFLEKNKNAEGIVEIEPGKLQYTILLEGNGPAVAAGGTPQIKYVGKYLDGTVFGNSEEVGGPLTIPLSQTIQGFSRGLVGMKEGEKRRLFVHPDMGYGTMGQLPPNAMLIFDVEVVKNDTPNYKPNDLSQMMQDGRLGEDDDYDDDYDDDDYDDEDEDDSDIQANKDNKAAAVKSNASDAKTTAAPQQSTVKAQTPQNASTQSAAAKAQPSRPAQSSSNYRQH